MCACVCISHPPCVGLAACMSFVLLTCIFPQFDVFVCVFNHLIREFLIVLPSSCCNLCKRRVCAVCVRRRKCVHCGPSSCLKSFVKRCLTVRELNCPPSLAKLFITHWIHYIEVLEVAYILSLLGFINSFFYKLLNSQHLQGFCAS